MEKIIFFDMDGTIIYKDEITGQPVISQKLKEVLKKVQEKGHKLFIATGRPYAFLAPEILDFGFDGYVLANGSCVLYHGDYIAHTPLNKEDVEELVNEFEKEKLNMYYSIKITHI